MPAEVTGLYYKGPYLFLEDDDGSMITFSSLVKKRNRARLMLLACSRCETEPRLPLPLNLLLVTGNITQQISRGTFTS
jgi:hypothetical protein